MEWSSQTVLVTGANRGIGLELCRQLQALGADVVAVCRNASEPLSELGVRVIENIDVSDDASLQQLATALGSQQIDCLVNNAGVLDSDSLEDFDTESIEWQFRINALGPLRLTRAVLSNLGPGARVGIVTSRMGSIGDNTSGGYYGYRMSKAAVNMAGVSLAHDLRERGVSVALLHPGMVATDMTGGNGVPVAKAAQGLIDRLAGLNPDNSGSFWHAEGYGLPW
ncbi:MAG: SDR family oxidoreductase [Xanthomonadales bacterium]|nr:SDR family oxidoreductase [Xanthomonadales bacterium]